VQTIRDIGQLKSALFALRAGGQRGYLSIRTNYRPGEKWTDHVGGEVGLFGFFLPGWGMHLADMEEAQGDLIREIGELANAR
jgi:hypothetical protein